MKSYKITCDAMKKTTVGSQTLQIPADARTEETPAALRVALLTRSVRLGRGHVHDPADVLRFGR